jgi:hypothetical protein
LIVTFESDKLHPNEVGKTRYFEVYSGIFELARNLAKY